MRNNVIIKCQNNAPGVRYCNGSEFRARTKQLSVLSDEHKSVLLLADGLHSDSKLGLFSFGAPLHIMTNSRCVVYLLHI